MKVNKLYAILDLLRAAGFGEEDVGGGHDVIFLPVTDRHPIHEDFEDKLSEAGAHWSDEYGCWIVFASC